MTNLFNYIDRPSPIHRLSGASKLVCLLLWSVAAMTSFYTPLLVFLTVLALILFRMAKLRIKDVSFTLGIMLVYIALNNILIFLFSPAHGVELYGSRTVLIPLPGRYSITAEQLFYHLNVILKNACTIPPVILFVCTTNPSEFAASLNRIGVSYRISYSVALALRYIPDIQREYHDISLAQQARGVEMSKKANLIHRLKAASTILIPLVLSSMERIETISNAMELRGFGKGKKRTWYAGRPFTPADYGSMLFCALLLIASLALTAINGGRFFNPFR
ncbi:MAG: energy-coupling factor transporter transmembrane component T [Oscillospiraceae bacterium]|nr:energy-coupling factor transporter transmembrane component T [Oscillospiraceae bacterium]MDY5641456.1 energy-coupling factor transporter transmembrane component T [Candidatus Faecousia sp.]